MQTSESREIVLALTILFILGAWAATAQDLQLTESKEINLAEYGISSKSNRTFASNDLTWWKSVQLQAAAMSEPSSLLKYSVGRSSTLGDVVARSSVDNWQSSLNVGGGTFKVGVMFAGGQFVELADSALCAASTKCDAAVWRAFGDVALKGGDNPINVLVGDLDVLGQPIIASDLKVFWTADASKTDPWGIKTVLKSTN